MASPYDYNFGEAPKRKCQGAFYQRSEDAPPNSHASAADSPYGTPARAGSVLDTPYRSAASSPQPIGQPQWASIIPNFGEYSQPQNGIALPRLLTLQNNAPNGSAQMRNGFVSAGAGNFMYQPTPQTKTEQHFKTEQPFRPEQQYRPDQYRLAPQFKAEQPFTSELQLNSGQPFKTERNGQSAEQQFKVEQLGRRPTCGDKRVIDLTIDDDDDCVVLSQTTAQQPLALVQRTPLPTAPREPQLVFGMISDAKVKAHTVPATRTGMDRFPECWPCIPIALSRHNVTSSECLVIRAIDPSRKEFGVLDVNTARALAYLIDNKFIRTQARLYPRKKKLGEVVGASISEVLPLYINIYGPESHLVLVGRTLAEKGVRLSAPSQPDLGYRYMNASEGAAEYGARAVTVASVVKSEEDTKQNMIGVLDGLGNADDLPEREADSRVTTPLLRHQKQGLWFMMDKENERDWSSDDAAKGTLWEIVKRFDGQREFRHIITNQTIQHPPPLVRGGILADVMGLGKTLSILSLIVSTMDDANAYAEEEPEPGQLFHSKTTLLIAPLSTICNWEEQIKAHIEARSLSYHIYHGQKRVACYKKLSDYDIIISTYSVVSGEMINKSSTTPLAKMSFFRIVLDEAHQIRDQTTRNFKGCNAVEADRRWAVTGTPVQNRLSDLQALIKFVRVTPFDDNQLFKQFISLPFKAADPEGIRKVRQLVDSVTLRRLKDKIDLPPRNDVTVKLEFGEAERELHEVLLRQSRGQMDAVLKSGQLRGKQYLHVLQSILRLRQVCCHGRELLGEEDVGDFAGMTASDAIDLEQLDEKAYRTMPAERAYEYFRLMRETDEDTCAICLNKLEYTNAACGAKPVGIAYLTQCPHLICKTCCPEYKNLIGEDATPESHIPCPIGCNTFIYPTLFEIKEDEVEKKQKGKPKKVIHYRGPSVKVRALLASLHRNRQSEEPHVKSVVFTFWTSHMDLITHAFNEQGIKFVRLDGSMNRAQRNQAIEYFREDPTIEVFLISLSAGGLGLNLTVASRVYVMEPQFNPAAEAQAVDRVHRLGQKRAVTITRYIIENSFEERILELQQKKMDLANLSLSGKLSRGDLTKRRLEELRTLFR